MSHATTSTSSRAAKATDSTFRCRSGRIRPGPDHPRRLRRPHHRTLRDPLAAAMDHKFDSGVQESGPMRPKFAARRQGPVKANVPGRRVAAARRYREVVPESSQSQRTRQRRVAAHVTAVGSPTTALARHRSRPRKNASAGRQSEPSSARQSRLRPSLRLLRFTPRIRRGDPRPRSSALPRRRERSRQRRPRLRAVQSPEGRSAAD